MKIMESIRSKIVFALAAITLIFFALFGSTVLFLSRGLLEESTLLVVQVIGFILFVITGLWLMRVIGKYILKPVTTMIPLVDRVAGGELNVYVETGRNDEVSQLGSSLNRVLRSVSNTLNGVDNATREMVASIGEVVVCSEELASRTDDEAASITETSTTLESLTSLVTVNRDESREVGDTLASFNMEVQSRSELMTNVTETMKEIHESGKKIDDIVTVINDISFQTNLLALNAAVEAARAGEAGRGFAVVASEVRNLAQKTAESSKTIQDIVFKNVESTKRGMDLVNQTTEFFTSIIKIVQDIVTKIQSIAENANEQTTSVEQINTSVRKLEQIIRTGSQIVESLNSATNDLNTGSEKLGNMASRSATKAEDTIQQAVQTVPTEAVKKSQPTKSSVEERIPLHEPPIQKTVMVEDDFFNLDEGEFEEF